MKVRRPLNWKSTTPASNIANYTAIAVTKYGKQAFRYAGTGRRIQINIHLAMCMWDANVPRPCATTTGHAARCAVNKCAVRQTPSAIKRSTPNVRDSELVLVSISLTTSQSCDAQPPSLSSKEIKAGERRSAFGPPASTTDPGSRRPPQEPIH